MSKLEGRPNCKDIKGNYRGTEPEMNGTELSSS